VRFFDVYYDEISARFELTSERLKVGDKTAQWRSTCATRDHNQWYSRFHIFWRPLEGFILDGAQVDLWCDVAALEVTFPADVVAHVQRELGVLQCGGAEKGEVVRRGGEAHLLQRFVLHEGGFLHPIMVLTILGLSESRLSLLAAA